MVLRAKDLIIFYILCYYVHILQIRRKKRLVIQRVITMYVTSSRPLKSRKI